MGGCLCMIVAKLYTYVCRRAQILHNFTNPQCIDFR